MRVLYSANDKVLCGISESIEEVYGIDIQCLYYIDKDNYAAKTKDGTLLLKRIKENETHLIYVCGIYDYIRSKGFDNLLKIYESISGKKYMRIESEFFILCDYIDNTEGTIDYSCSSKEVISLIADFHKTSQYYSPPPGGKVKSDWGKWIEKYRMMCREMKRFKDDILNKGKKTAFEKMFLCTSETYIDRMTESVNILKRGGYIDAVEDSMRRRQICLGNFKPHNFYTTESDLNIKSLNKCRYDIVEKDIADFLQKTLEYGGNIPDPDFKSLVEEYHKLNPLSKNSIKLIKAFLLFPDEYEKVCSKYYRGKDKWSEEEYIERLKSAVSFEDLKMNLIDALE